MTWGPVRPTFPSAQPWSLGLPGLEALLGKGNRMCSPTEEGTCTGPQKQESNLGLSHMTASSEAHVSSSSAPEPALVLGGDWCLCRES